MGKINQLPPTERPREKAFRYGIETLSNAELLAILIGSGFHNTSALEISNRLLIESNGLTSLIDTSITGLTAFKGIGKVTAIRLSACFEIAKRILDNRFADQTSFDEKDLINKYYLNMSDLSNEVMVLIVLNNRKRVIYEETMYKGNESRVYLSPTEIVKKVILHNGKKFLIIHNHPNGTLFPSDDDLHMTCDLIREANRMKLTLIEHFIIAKGGCYSIISHKSFKIDLN